MLRVGLPHPVEAEADVVRMLVRRYLELGSVVRALASRGWRFDPVRARRLFKGGLE